MSELEIPDGLGDHCPRWAEQLQNYRTLDILRECQPIRLGDGYELDIFHAAKCFVGEKHGFSVAYYHPDHPNFCDICDRFSLKFMTPDTKIFNIRLQEFVLHCNAMHPLTTKKKKE